MVLARLYVIATVIGLAVHLRKSGAAFCAYLQRKFPEFENFLVMEAVVPDVTARPQKTMKQLSYMCR